MVQLVGGLKIIYFPVHRGFSLSGLNLAEVGHSSMKPNHVLIPVGATWEDIYTMIVQLHIYRKEVTNEELTTGKWPSDF